MWFSPKNIAISLILIILIWWSALATDFSLMRLFSSFENLHHFLNRFFPPNWGRAEMALNATLITLQVAFLGTFLALIVVLPISFLAAKNTAPNALLFHMLRSLLSFLRSVPDIVFGLILVVLVGLGPFAAVIAIFLHNIGVLGKLISELVEAAEKGPQEAVKSVGLSGTFVALYGILPQIIPNVLSHYFYRFEVAIRTSLILGFIGAGGIGQLLFNDFQTQRYDNVTLYVLLIMALVILVDMLGSYVRNRII